MPLTRAQLISGDKTKGTVLQGQVQGVKQGVGVLIDNNGTITFNAETAEGVVKTNNEEAFNDYVWPSEGPTDNSQLIHDSSNTLIWTPKEQFGFGLNLTGDKLKTQVTVSTSDPAIGSELGEAIQGSLYWKSDTSQLYICADGTSWTPAISVDSAVSEALLSGSYTLYVNPEIGSDEYVTGETDGIPTQMLIAGYTPQKPFKTIARAALEVARMQNGMGLDNLSYDRFLIKCSTGTHIVDNRLGSDISVIEPWESGEEPGTNSLKRLNSADYAGVILPRGVSIIGEDLRKTVIRPSYVPDRDGNIESDRGSIFRITGGAFFFNFTFKDQEGLEESHHLLDCFSFVTEADLEDYYAKTEVLFSQSYENQIVNPGETEIVAPQPVGVPTSSTDGVIGSSPYIFNCSIRSSYGLCGINADGNGVTGFRSMVVAQFTGTSLQKDMFCWQIYDTGSNSWEDVVSYEQYISEDPNNVRMNPNRRSFHIRALNNAFIQEVSVFAIGQGIHHWVKSGGEISITNSNSSFGGCAAVAEGYKTLAFPQDTNWNVGAIKTATNLYNQTRVVSNIVVGYVDSSTADGATTIKLENALIESTIYPGTPEILSSKGYSFAEDSYLWIENPDGPDWRAPLAEIAWDPNNPDEIVIQNPMENQDGDSPGEGDNPSLSGEAVYIRRLQDTRTQEQRRYSLYLTNTDSNVRTPLRDYVMQTSPGGSGNPVTGLLPDGRMVAVYNSGSVPPEEAPVVKKSEIVLGRVNPGEDSWTSGRYYRPGDTVTRENKHFTCLIQNSDTAFDPNKWNESYVHMGSGYNAYDYANNVAPRVIFDDDRDGEVNTDNCGYEFDPLDPQYCWDTNAKIRAQYRTSTDFRGIKEFLFGIGFSNEEINEILLPRNFDDREINPADSGQMGGYVPDGAADSLGNWPVEFRRPSVIRLFSHAWEWAGYLNYTKSLPSYQGDLSAQNQFTYYFTNVLGGRVYASGYNQEGYLVTAAGLTDLASGATTDVASIGNEVAGIDTGGNIPDPLVVNSLVVNDSITFPDNGQANATTWRSGSPNPANKGFGIVRLARISELTNTNPPIATSNAEIDLNPNVVTINGLNRWKQAQRLVSSGTGSVNIYVNSRDPLNPSQRNPDNRQTDNQLLETPPTSPENAVATLERAAQYANLVISGNQTAVVRIAAGLYDPSSRWECNVQFIAYGNTIDFADGDRTFPSTTIQENTSDNDWFDGSYYGVINNTNNSSVVNFWTFNVVKRDQNTSPTDTLAVICSARGMGFQRSVTFTGGFHFLGMAKLINLLSDPGHATNIRYPANFTIDNFILDQSGNPIGNDYTAGFTSDMDNNLDTLLAEMISDIGATDFQCRTSASAISCRGSSTDVALIRDCSFGGAIPCHKEGGGGPEGNPYISLNGIVAAQFYNIYVRGYSRITSDGLGISTNLPLGTTPPYGYGTGNIESPWTWRQTHHTFISTPPGATEPLLITRVGGTSYVLNNLTNGNTRSYYKDRGGSKYLPNHIHLLTNSGAEPGDNNSGPFFDQFIHAKYGVTIEFSWQGNATENNSSGAKVHSGFVGKFGSSGYDGGEGTDRVPVRGIRLGDVGSLEPERSYSITFGRSVIGRSVEIDGDTYPYKSIFQVAGGDSTYLDTSPINTDYFPDYFPDTVTEVSFGEGYPAVNNPDDGTREDGQVFPVITASGGGDRDNTYWSELNLGTRCLRAGISSEYGNIIKGNYVI